VKKQLSHHDGGFAAGKTAQQIDQQANNVPSSAVAADLLSPEERHLRVSRAAYQLAELRNFAPGSELEDWLCAEREVDAETNA
jgi:DUF2934 family protein